MRPRSAGRQNKQGCPWFLPHESMNNAIWHLTRSDSHRGGITYLKRCVEIAAAAGVKIIGGPIFGSPLVFAGRVPEPIDEAQRLSRIQRVVAGLQEAGDYAMQHGVEFAIEPLNRFETDFCNTSRQAVELATQVGSPAVKVMLDTFHMNMEEDDLGRAIRRAAGYLVHFQANENHRGYLGTGHINWGEICQALVEIGYGGPIIFGTVPPHWHRVVAAARTVAFTVL